MRKPTQDELFVLWPDGNGLMRRLYVDRVIHNLTGFWAIRGTKCFVYNNHVYEASTAHSTKEADAWLDQIFENDPARKRLQGLEDPAAK